MKDFLNNRIVSIAALILSVFCLFIGWIGLRSVEVPFIGTISLYSAMREVESAANEALGEAQEMLEWFEDEDDSSEYSDALKLAKSAKKCFHKIKNDVKSDSISPLEWMTSMPSGVGLIHSVEKSTENLEEFEDLLGGYVDESDAKIILTMKLIKWGLILFSLLILCTFILGIFLIVSKFYKIPLHKVSQISKDINQYKKWYLINMVALFVINIVVVVLINKFVKDLAEELLENNIAYITVWAVLGLVATIACYLSQETEEPVFEKKPFADVKILSTCPSCGKQILANARFCTHCGTQINTEIVSRPPVVQPPVKIQPEMPHQPVVQEPPIYPSEAKQPDEPTKPVIISTVRRSPVARQPDVQLPEKESKTNISDNSRFKPASHDL